MAVLANEVFHAFNQEVRLFSSLALRVSPPSYSTSRLRQLYLCVVFQERVWHSFDFEEKVESTRQNRFI